VRERLYFNVTEDTKKALMEAFKNEQSYIKQIPLYDMNDEELCKVIKMDVYNSYVDFTLNNIISDYMIKEPGKIQTVELYDFQNKKGQIIKRIKKISA